ncbi:MAG: rRNA adenine N-6-methyltransferase family protein [Sphingorhabdus sp.]
MPKADFQAARQAMIDSQLRTSGVNEPWVIAAMGAAAREDFVPKDRAAICYMDRSIPLGGGRMLNPAVATGMMLAEAEPTGDDNILLVGAATGYVASLLAPRCKNMVAIEEDADLAKRAKAAAKSFENIQIVESPLSEGHAGDAPYSLIWIDGAIEILPDAQKDQLANGGRIITGLKEGPVTRLAVGIKRGGEIALRSFADVEIADLPGFAKAREFAF